MPKLKMLTCLSSTDGVFDIGDPYECDDAQAERLIDAGFAEPWVDDEQPEQSEEPTEDPAEDAGEPAGEPVVEQPVEARPDQRRIAKRGE